MESLAKKGVLLIVCFLCVLSLVSCDVFKNKSRNTEEQHTEEIEGFVEERINPPFKTQSIIILDTQFQIYELREDYAPISHADISLYEIDKNTHEIVRLICKVETDRSGEFFMGWATAPGATPWYKIQIEKEGYETAFKEFPRPIWASGDYAYHHELYAYLVKNNR